MKRIRKKWPIKNIMIFIGAALFIAMVLSLGVTYAIEAHQMRISGQAYFVYQATTNPDKLPMYPVEVDGDGSGHYFQTIANGQETIHIIEQKYENDDFHLKICTNNSNNGNTSWSVSFQLMNPTSYAWTNGRVTRTTPIPNDQGGLPNKSFTFNTPSLTPSVLSTGDIATVTMPMQSQLGKNDTQGSAMITITYDVSMGGENTPRSTNIYFYYYARNSSECPL